MGFVAQYACAKLDYDFSGVGVKELDGVRGTSPEPSNDQVLAMRASLRELFGVDDPDPAALNRRLAAMSTDELRERDDELIAIYAAVCSNEPSAEQIRALPHRHRAAYFGYLSGELNNPTGGSSVTNLSLAPRRTA